MNNMDTAFELILHAGNSRSASMMAIEAAREYDFEEAERLAKEADKELLEAHDIQTSLIQAEAGGENIEMNIIMVHAQDHLTMAMTELEHMKEFIHIYQLISQIMEVQK